MIIVVYKKTVHVCNAIRGRLHIMGVGYVLKISMFWNAVTV